MNPVYVIGCCGSGFSEEARELLRGSPVAIKEIADKLHFSDEYYFASVFKRKTGIAPGRYRSWKN